MKACKIIPFPFKRRKKDILGRLYTLRVYLTQGPFGKKHVGQEIYRTIQILGDQTLEDLHQAIFIAFGREEDRPYAFSFGQVPCDRSGPRYIPVSTVAEDSQGAACVAGDARETTLDSLMLKENLTFGYWFDAEPEWGHLVHVVSMESPRPKQQYPMLVEVVGDAPPQDRPLEEEIDPLSEVTGPDMFNHLMEALQIRRRVKIESMPLTCKTRLQPALNKLPAVWVKGICRQLGLAGQRKEQCVTMIADFLKKPKNQTRIWKQLPLLSRKMLHWILVEQGGWVSMQKLSRKFGADEDISWWWDEGQTPVTPLGLLRVHGIVYLGRASQGKSNSKIAAVPVELREGFQKQATAARAFENAPPMPEEESPEDVLNGLLSKGNCGQSAYFTDLPDEIESMGLEEFLEKGRYTRETERVYTRMLGKIRRNPSEFSRDALREFLERIIRAGNTWSRLTAYKLGVRIFGKPFAEKAQKDESRMVREWAERLFDISQGELF